MSSISAIGLDIAKNVFQVHGVDSRGAVVVRRQLRRGQVLGYFAGLAPCLVGLEACATGHYWGRELRALGHEVRLIPPQYVKPYVKRNKTDAADAEAICEAVVRNSGDRNSGDSILFRTSGGGWYVKLVYCPRNAEPKPGARHDTCVDRPDEVQIYGESLEDSG